MCVSKGVVVVMGPGNVGEEYSSMKFWDVVV